MQGNPHPFFIISFQRHIFPDVLCIEISVAETKENMAGFCIMMYLDFDISPKHQVSVIGSKISILQS